jgi:hypothetical protein
VIAGGLCGAVYLGKLKACACEKHQNNVAKACGVLSARLALIAAVVIAVE